MKYIPDWYTKKLTCSVCGSQKSVKYEAENGKPMCNKCICINHMASQIDFDFPEDNPKQDYEAFHYR
jgi:transcription elongation factor Elf1